jgi:hypothetical protein
LRKLNSLTYPKAIASHALLKQYLLIDPDSVPTRINLGYVNTKLGLWADVEAGADLLLTNPGDLVPHELYTVHQQKALGALSRSDYDTAITFAEKAFAHEGDFFDIGLIQLAAALKGDVDKVREAARTFQQKRPKDFEAFKFRVDSAEALALAVGGQDELARRHRSLGEEGSNRRPAKRLLASLSAGQQSG